MTLVTEGGIAMRYEGLSAVTFLSAMVVLLIFAVTDDVYFGIGSIIFVVLSAEFRILGAIEKTKEGR